MSKKEKIIAFIFDFDDTLIYGNMQQVLFDEYNVDANLFWSEVENLSVAYNENNCNIITNEMIYLSHFLTYVREGIFRGLNNKILFELGSKLKFFEGVIDLFKEISEINKSLKKSDAMINIYIVSSGFRQMILGSSIASYVTKVWACEFVDSYLMPFYQSLDNKFSENSVLSSVCYFVDHTIKTRVIFELNKGSYDKINKRIPKSRREIPFENMFYIADGFNDIPAFEILNNNLNHYKNTLTVYYGNNENAKKLVAEKRVGDLAEANYGKGTKLYNWIMEKIFLNM
ncbi:HAD family hydrolase [Borrelia hispanica]|uniref:haloacid dehalogenase-like hydrolase n=1 Tax=Borrelia hispanica TaxID=40835 RepID=UPI000462F6FB|nr:haloacid dehalogenase-like hydrolase [Borrelia hispanica]